MKIEIKNVKYAEFASEETNCFNASVYIDGVKAGTVSNDGNGGCDMFQPWELEKRLNEYAKTLPPIDCTEFGGEGTMESSAGIIIGDLMNEWLRNRDLKKMCAKKVLFRKPNEKYADGEYHSIKGKLTPELKLQLINKYGTSVFILNEQVVV